MITRHHLPSAGWLGYTRHETDKFRITELVYAIAHQDRARLAFYTETSDALAKRTGQASGHPFRYLIPHEVLARDLTASSPSGGGYTVDTKVSFSSGLFGASLIGNLPLRPMPMESNSSIAVPTSISTQWLATEATATNHADPAFGLRTGTPKTIVCNLYLGRNLAVLLGPDAAFLEQQAGQKLAEQVGAALINGSGVNGEPLGLLNLAGTASTAGTSLAWAGVRDLIAASEGYTVGGLVWVLGVTTAKLLRAREKATGSGMIFADGKIDGIPAIVSRCVPTDAMVLAPWPTISMQTWGALEVEVTPLADPTAFRSGKIGVRLLWSIDFTPDFPAVIAKSTSIT